MNCCFIILPVTEKYASPANSFHTSFIQSTRIQKWPHQYLPKLFLSLLTTCTSLFFLTKTVCKVALTTSAPAQQHHDKNKSMSEWCYHMTFKAEKE